jgi:predicted ArsR family transcriptional regulator
MSDTDRTIISDHRVLVALAHPVRLGLLFHLLSAGPQTATECAGVVDATPSACSYHLRYLEGFGLVARVEDDEDIEVDGRTRRWRAASVSYSFGPISSDDSPDERAAKAALSSTRLDENARLAQEYLSRADELTKEWQRASTLSSYDVDVSAEELVQVLLAIDDLLRPVRAATRTETPDDSRRVRVIVDAFPRFDRP